jgi:hypothetical protein
MTPQKFNCFFAYEYLSKKANFYADFKSVEVTGNKCTWKKLLAENFGKLVIEKSANSKFLLFTSLAQHISESSLVWILE